MKSHITITIIAVLVLISSSDYTMAVEVTDFESGGDTAGQYEKYEISFNLDQEFRNPFDPKEIDIQAVFTGPSGAVHTAFAFCTQDFERVVREVLYEKRKGEKRVWKLRNYEPLSERYWQVRFAPPETGEYRCHLNIKTRRGEYRYPAEGEITFHCVPSGNRGYLKVDQKNRRYLRFDDGSPYFGIGFNSVNTAGALYGYDVPSYEFIPKAAAEGATIGQIDLCQGDYLEWTAEERRLRPFPYYADYQNLGRYNLKTASQIDEALEAAAASDLMLRFSFYHWSDFMDVWADYSPGFIANPYNTANGGPCETPIKFFTDFQAEKYQQQVFRYIAARWGYSPHILCWELWNEVDNVPEFAVRPVQQWHNRSAEYLRSIDPNHLITTSCIRPDVTVQMFSGFDADIITFHCYVQETEEHPMQMVENMVKFSKMVEKFGKPVIPGEFGMFTDRGDALFFNPGEDSEGLGLHNQMWTSLMMGNASTGMPWAWEEQIEKFNLYHHSRGISRFVAGEDLAGFEHFGEEGIKVVCRKRNTETPHIDYPSRSEKREGVRPAGRYIKKQLDEARAYGLSGPDKAFVWVQDRGHVFMAHDPAPSVKGVEIVIAGINDGAVTIEFWDTMSGEITNTVPGYADGGITVQVPEFTGDIAFKVISEGKN